MPRDPDDDLDKSFRSHAPGFWAGDAVAAAQWNDYRWQLRHRLVSLAALEARLGLTADERAGLLLTGARLASAVTPHFLNLVDRNDPACPIRRQVVPRLAESHEVAGEMADPGCEDGHMPVPGLVHRYPDRVLLLVTDRCAAYCRYCTRSRIVSGAGPHPLETDFEQAYAYLRQHAEVRDVLLSGGDPLLLADGRLEEILGRLRAIPHLEVIRIGTRIPVFLPQRVTPALCSLLRRFHPLWMSVHANHPRELTTEVRQALGLLADSGIPLGNQSVLLRGVNDSVEVQRALVHKLMLCRVRPYYLYQCDPVPGTAHLRTSVEEGIRIIEGLRGHTTGYAVPQFVIDAPGGGGKVPVNPDSIVRRDAAGLVLRNYEGKEFLYPC